MEDLNAFASETEEDDYEGRLKKVDALFELYQKGAISKEEFETRKEILMRD
ncbi:SHOCT domain-containing protein [uncultured Campylobacter sp.]|uniref:SHOCT domain-containing protein n=1 Tax=uncultured Campylobacter sp. TaxID=218934 RepID=UPI002635B2A4|nr:SHOCT domain-containing protein [uncultured Campylobacter sp.]